MLGFAEKVVLVLFSQLAAGNNSLQRMVIGFESHIHWNNFEVALKPKATDLLQSDALAKPTPRRWRFRLIRLPSAF